MKFDRMADFKTLDEFKKRKLPAKDDHEMILELRRGLIGFVEDMRDFGFLWNAYTAELTPSSKVSVKEIWP